MGHENVGVIAKAGEVRRSPGRAARATGSSSSTTSGASLRVVPPRRVPPLRADRLAHEPRRAPLRLPSVDNPPPLGRLRQYMYLPWNAVMHRVPDGVTAELAGIVTPLSNGIEWALYDCGVASGPPCSSRDPGSRGCPRSSRAKQAGASLIVVTGTSRDAARLELAKVLGADAGSTSSRRTRSSAYWRSPAARASTSSSTAPRAGTAPVLLGIDALKRRGRPAHPGRARGVPRLPAEEAHREGDHDQERARHSYARSSSPWSSSRRSGSRWSDWRRTRSASTRPTRAIRTGGRRGDRT